MCKKLRARLALCLAAAVLVVGAFCWQDHSIPHFRLVRAGVLYRSGQPRDFGLDAIRLIGVRTVINLRGAEKEAAPEVMAERRQIEDMGGTLHCLSVGATAAELGDTVDEFLRIMADPAARPVLVHCARGKERTGLCAAVFRMEYDGWSNQDALDEAYRLGLRPGTYPVIEQFIRDYEPRSRVGAVQHNGFAIDRGRIVGS